MIIFNKKPVHKKASSISHSLFKGRRRLNNSKKLTKNNKKFLLALGFKV